MKISLRTRILLIALVACAISACIVADTFGGAKWLFWVSFVALGVLFVAVPLWVAFDLKKEKSGA